MAFPFTPDPTGQSVENVAHLIQMALTPVFMLSGIGTLLNLFNTRLARVSDHLRQISDLLAEAQTADERHTLKRHVRRLHRRMMVLDTSIFLAAIGGAATCGAALVLFLGSVREAAIGSALTLLFGLALLCTVAALGTFLLDSIFSWHGIRTEGPLPKARS
jgi:hypothetical protein